MTRLHHLRTHPSTRAVERQSGRAHCFVPCFDLHGYACDEVRKAEGCIITADGVCDQMDDLSHKNFIKLLIASPVSFLFEGTIMSPVMPHLLESWQSSHQLISSI